MDVTVRRGLETRTNDEFAGPVDEAPKMRELPPGCSKSLGKVPAIGDLFADDDFANSIDIAGLAFSNLQEAVVEFASCVAISREAGRNDYASCPIDVSDLFILDEAVKGIRRGTARDPYYSPRSKRKL
jgi:hypothetical protein